MMIGQDSALLPQTGPKRDSGHAAASLANSGEDGTLILDGTGTIRGCSAVAEAMFGSGRIGMIGRQVSEFIAGLSRGGSSPSFSERYLMYLCADQAWRRFQALDADGCEFEVELKLSRIRSDGQEVFALNLRRVEESSRL